MKSIAVFISSDDAVAVSNSMNSLGQCPMVTKIALACDWNSGSLPFSFQNLNLSESKSTTSVLTILDWFFSTSAQVLLWVEGRPPFFHGHELQRWAASLTETSAAGCFADYVEGSTLHALCDYQLGSLRDDFDFGPAWMLNRVHLQKVISDLREVRPGFQLAGFYDLRLRLTEQGSLIRLSEPLYQVSKTALRASGQAVFDYVDPKHRQQQREMEEVATAYLKRIGAFISKPDNALVPETEAYPVDASVVIPVKNRVKTVGAAVQSALSQKSSFDYNVLVVDNHSIDGTFEVLDVLSKKHNNLIHLVPERQDLGIGGCWNHAVFSRLCGRYAIQLDSDDLYSQDDVLERIILEFKKDNVAMVIGSYTTVDFDLSPRPPGLVDHREWSDDNGANNALRVAGLGAPRAFHVPTLRTIGFPNVSYGEDYALGLRLCRDYRIGRIYDSLYWCRRWEQNSDAGLSLEVKNRYDQYKDRLRTLEILARQSRNQGAS